jgi:hypothetical protein
MRITKLLFICMCCLIAAPAVWGQAANSPAKPGILGYLDPHTGSFRPLPLTVEDDAELAAATTFTGTITVTLTITLKTTSLTLITCTADVTALDASNTVALEESDTVAGTGSGSTRTCKLTIPYAWSLTTQSTDSMRTSYTVLGTAGATGLPQRTSSRIPLDTRHIPGTGVITTLSAAVTL